MHTTSIFIFQEKVNKTSVHWGRNLSNEFIKWNYKPTNDKLVNWTSCKYVRKAICLVLIISTKCQWGHWPCNLLNIGYTAHWYIHNSSNKQSWLLLNTWILANINAMFLWRRPVSLIKIFYFVCWNCSKKLVQNSTFNNSESRDDTGLEFITVYSCHVYLDNLIIYNLILMCAYSFQSGNIFTPIGVFFWNI